MKNVNQYLDIRILTTLTLTFLALVLMTSMVNASEVMTAEDIASLKYVEGAVISPDGKHIAYNLTIPRNLFEEDNGSSWKELHVTDLEGNNRPFITGEVRVGSLDWTPDGKVITYLAKRSDDDTTTTLYGIPITGGESKKLLAFKTSINSYVWGPDSQQLVFLAKPAKDKSVDSLEELGFNAEIYEEDWRDTKVWLHNLAYPEIDPTMLDLPGTAGSISISPDGSKLLLTLAPTPSVDDSYMFRTITTVDLNTKEIIHQFDHEGKVGRMVWSPDSKQFAVIAARDINDPSSGEVYVASADGGPLAPLMTDLDGHVRRIVWQDDKTILYILDSHVHSSVGTVTISDSKRKTLIEPGHPIFRSFSLSDNAKAISFIGESPQHDAELFATSTKKMKPQRLTNSNPWLSNRLLGRQEVITHNARDGLELEGLLIHPINEQPGVRYPLVLIVHGGPESHRIDGWLNWSSSPAQVFAGQGYAVFVPNYRGSTGRGIEFSKMGQAGYAESEFDDLVDAVNHLIEIGLVDKDRVGITGGSYGGYASAWGATALTDHFAASVMGVGISDLISKFGTTDIPWEMYHVHARTWPWENWQWYLERSPIYYAQQSKTPLLILHGKNDTRVHPSQSMEMYRYLKTFGQAPVRMVFYPGEGHGNRKAAARYDYSLRLLRWMDHYLKGPGGDPPSYELDYSQLEDYQTSED